MAGEIVINEVLCYIENFRHCSTVSNLSRVVIDFFTNDEILEAKKELWRIRKEFLPDLINRQTSAKRSEAEANTSDILDALRKVEEEDKLPVFVAKIVKRLPSSHPEELNVMSLLNRVKQLENTVSVQSDSLVDYDTRILELKSDVEDGKKEKNLIKAKVASNYADATKKSVSKDENNKKGQNGKRPMNGDKTAHGVVVTNGTDNPAVSGASANINGVSAAVDNKIDNVQVENVDESEDNNDSFNYPRQYNKKIKRKEARKVARGTRTGEVNGFGGAPPPSRDIFVYRVSTGNEESILNYLKSNSVDVRKVEKISHENSTYASFKVSVSVKDTGKLIGEENILPVGVLARRYWNKKEVKVGVNSSNGQSTNQN